MKKILVFSILLLSAIAVTIGTTITTATIQIHPAYSQTMHCTKSGTLQQLEVWTCTNVRPPSTP